MNVINVHGEKVKIKDHCIQLHLLVISIEYYDARNNEYKTNAYSIRNSFRRE